MKEITEAINEKSFMQMVKSKNKSSSVGVIKKTDFIAVCQTVVKQGLSDAVLEAIEPLVYLNPKYREFYQVKNLGFLFNEVGAQADLTQNADVAKGQDGAQVVSFKQLESDEEH